MLDTPTRSLSAADTPDTLVFSATECTIEAGGSYELPVPTDPEGSFVLYEYHEKTGEGVRFTVKTDSGRELVDL